MSSQPPRLALLLLRRRIPADAQEFVLGDLNERFEHKALVSGAARARAWFWRETASAFTSRWNYRVECIEPSLKGDSLMQTLVQDLRWALKILRARPASSAAIVLTLALAIGANSTIFSWINRVLINPLPAVDVTSLYEFEQTSRLGSFSLSYPDYMDIRKQAHTVTLAGREDYAVSLSTGDQLERVWSEIVTDNYFDVLQVRPVLGRGFRTTDSDASAEPVLLISHRLWQRRFAGEPSIVGRQVRVNEQPFTIIGVAPPDFAGSTMGIQLDLFIPMSPVHVVIPGGNRLERRGNHWFKGIARLQPGVTIAQSREEMTIVARRLSEIVPDYKEIKAELTPLAESENGGIGILRPVLLALMLVVALILLIACANIANLLLAQASTRRREIAIRLSMGATRGRLFRQLLTEALVLAVTGAAAGLVLTRSTAGLLERFAPPSDLPISMSVTMDGRVLLFTVIATLAATLLFGLLPALRLSSPALNADIKEGAASSGSRNRLRNCLVVVQVSLSLALLVSAGVCMKSLHNMESVNPGFNKDGVLLASIDLFTAGYDANRGTQAFANLLDELKKIPGVTASTLARHVPLGFTGLNTSSIEVDGYTPQKDEVPMVAFTPVGPNYLNVMNIPLVAGRDILDSDRRESPPVAVISETMATRYWKGSEAVGGRFRFGSNSPWITVAGVARDMKWRQMKEQSRPFVYLPVLQSFHPSTVIHLRTAGDPVSLTADVREAVRQVLPDVPVFGVRTLAAHMSASSFQQSLASRLLGAFGLLALALAAVGQYGVLAFVVGQRTREIGIRVAVGARPGDVFRMVLRQGVILTVVGTLIGTVVSLGLGMAMSGLLFGVSPADPFALSAGIAVLLITTLSATLIPARRAMRMDPAVALRCD